jgi:hypothetical protein
MEDNENPYKILGVPKDATQQQIKVAYRKLALKHHPDKQSTDEGRQQATVSFAKISNAYEILGDEHQREQYDRESSGRVNRPYSKMPRHQQHDDHFFHHAHFHDPFSVFESFFRDEFGGDFFGSNGFRQPRQQQQQQQQQRRSAFNDPFFGGAGAMFNDPFFSGGFSGGHDPFFGGGGMMGGGDPFFGGGNLFASMNRQMNDMMNMHQNISRQQHQQQHQMQHQQQLQNPGNRQSFVSYTSTSSSNLMGGRNGESVSKSTTTRIINGRRQVVTERVVQKADGTVERHVETSADDDFPGGQPRLSNGDSRRQRQALGYQQPEQQHRERRDSRKSKTERRDSGQRLDSAQRQRDARQKRSLFKRKRRDSSLQENQQEA